ncbi:MAG: inositol monophosphatase family protein [candidate division WOR-3 bacterium]
MTVERDLLKSVIYASKEAGKILLKHFGKNLKVEEKGLRDIVTDADKESEEFLRGFLTKEFPDISFFGEEGGGKIGGLSWMVDPLDGTKNFAKGLDVFAVSVALLENGKPVMGVIHIPTKDLTFWASEGFGAYCNGKRLVLDDGEGLEKSFIATGFPHGNPELVDPYIEGLRKVLKRAMAVRRMGSAAYDLAMVAYGMFDGFWEFGLKPWDTAAGAVIVREAGAILTDIHGNDWNINSLTILTAKKNLHAELVRLFKSEV